MNAEHAINFLCDELKHSVDKSGHLEVAEEIVS